MSVPRLLAYLLGTLTLAAGLYATAELTYLGFPDGHLTGLEQMKAKLLPYCAVANLLSSGYFCYLGLRAQDPTSAQRLFRAALGYLLLLGLAGVIYYAQTATVDVGSGG